MRKYVIDLETVSKADLKVVGARNMAQDPDTFISCLHGYSIDDDKYFSINHAKINTNDNYDRCDNPDIFRQFFYDIQDKNAIIIGHNVRFEKLLIESKLIDLVNPGSSEIIEIPNTNLICTMALSMMCRGFRSLDDASDHFKIGVSKDEIGKKIMLKVCRITNKKYKCYTIDNTVIEKIDCGDGYWRGGGSDAYRRINEYCKYDVMCSLRLYQRLLPLAKQIHGHFFTTIWRTQVLTWDMNDRGIRINKDLLDKAKLFLDNRNATIEEHYKQAQLPFVPTQKAKIMTYINNRYGFNFLPNMQRETLRQVLKVHGDKMQPADKDILDKYIEYSDTSTAKIKSMSNKHTNYRLHDEFLFYGANTTGRWSSSGVQLQNIPRPEIGLPETAHIDEPLGDTALRNFFNISLKSVLRPLLIPEKDEKFFIVDLTSIELVLNFYLCKRFDVMQKVCDGTDMYVDFIRQVFKIDEVSEEMRNIGKICMLALQYGKSEYALLKDLNGQADEKTIKKAYEGYHILYPEVKQQWRRYDGLIRYAYHQQEPLMIKLLTGRKLNYGLLKKVKKEFFNGNVGDTFVYRKTSPDDGFWNKEPELYGSKAYQNVVQATGVDIIIMKAHGMVQAGYNPMMLQHDEGVFSVPKCLQLSTINDIWEHAGKENLNYYFPSLVISSKGGFHEHYTK